MIDTNAETLIAIRDVPELLPKRNGRRLCYETIRQWTAVGRQGVLLETVWVGGGKFTTRTAIRNFLQELTQARQPQNRLPGSIDVRAATEAVRRLEKKLGI